MKFALAAFLFLPLLACANDGIGSVGVGGIVFRHTDAIAMKKEVLNVGHDLISVDYEFVNESPAEVEETIIFPLPAYSAVIEASDAYYGQPDGFSIAVDGKPVAFRTVVRALFDGADVTAQLKKVGLSDAQIAYNPGFGKTTNVAPMTARQRQQLVEAGLIVVDPTEIVGPVWKTQVNYVWQQRFPVNKVVRVHHAYRPFVATGPGEFVMNDGIAKFYCADAAFLKSWRRLARPGYTRESDFVPAAKVSYILKTGNTFRRGIEDFTLNVVKSAPTEIVSLCFPGTFRKIDARTYQVRLRNFRPTSDLEVYFGNVESAGPNDGKMPVLNR